MTYEIDRAKKFLRVASRKTNMQLMELPWKSLFDNGKEQFQEEVTNKLADDEFILAISSAMAQLGYRVISVER